MFDDFKKAFYEYDEFVGGSQINFAAFKSLFPIVIFDLTKQSTVVKTSNGYESHFKLCSRHGKHISICVYYF